jgi:hypothetical protein
MLDEELAEIVANLRAIGGDIAEIEVKRASPRSKNARYRRNSQHPLFEG